jgi:integrase
MIISFFALLRSAELLGLTIKNISVDRIRKFLTIKIEKSKTDICGRGATVAVGCLCETDSASSICPFHRMCEWLEKRVNFPQNDESVFPIRKDKYYSELKRRLMSVLPPELHTRCTSHSMRRSGAMAMITSGISLERVAELGRWSGTETLASCYLRGSSTVQTAQAELASWVVRLL